MRRLALFLSLMLMGCANTHYVRFDATPEQAEADRQACMQQGEIAVASLDSDNPFEIGMRRITIADNCMRLKGYTPAG
jgi:hypothetical protein